MQDSTGAVHTNFYCPKNEKFYAGGQYKVCNPDNQEIRLLDLLPGSGDNEILCELQQNIPLVSAFNKYEAISYCAGDPTKTSDIVVKVNGAVFNVFANLGAALQRIRRTREQLGSAQHLVWADQICINQSEPVERAHQVMMMRQIYTNANRVMIWLGGDTSEGDGIEFLKCQYANLRELEDNFQKGIRDPEVSLTPDDWRAGLSTHLAASYVTRFFQIEDENRRQEVGQWFSSLAEITRSKWWLRGWICQEVVVARAATILCGSNAIDWDEFAVAWPIIRDIVSNFVRQAMSNGRLLGDTLTSMLRSVGLDKVSRIEFIVDTKIAWSKNNLIELRTLSTLFRSSKVSDPRDRIYSLLGLCNPEYMVEPDYRPSNTVACVFRHISRRIILCDRRLDILCHTQRYNGTFDTDLPSWVPDWSEGDTTKSLGESTGKFQASRDKNAYASFPDHHHYGPGRILRTQCLLVDKLAHTRSLGSPGQSEDGASLRTTHDAWLAILKRENAIAYANQVQAFQGTLLQGATDESLGDGYGVGAERDLQSRDEYVRERKRDLVENSLGGDWRFFISPKGFMGLSNFRTRCTDHICILLGASVPFVVRKCGNHYVLVGEAYVHNLMHGEAIDMRMKKKLVTKTIDIW